MSKHNHKQNKNQKSIDTSSTRGLSVEQQKQVAEYKKQYPKGVHIIRSEGKIGFLRNPERPEIAYAMTLMPDQLAYAESLMDACWLSGDRELITEDRYFLAVFPQVDSIIDIAMATLEKL